MNPPLLSRALPALLLAPSLAPAQDPAPRLVAESTTDLATRMLALPGDDSGNLVVSPWSLLSALGMTREGAAGETRAQIGEMLGIGADADLPAAIAAFRQDIARASGFEWSDANSLFVDQGYELNREFQENTKASFGAAPASMPLLTDPEQSRRDINEWVSENTGEMFPEFLKPGSLDDTAMVLVNAIYFKGGWATPFDAERTSPAAFTSADGETAEVPMMHARERWAAAITEDWQAVALPYRSNPAEGVDAAATALPRLELLVVLPGAGKAIGDLQAAMNPGFLQGVVDGLRQEEVQLSLPRFTVEIPTTSLKDLLQDGGRLGLPFSNKADFPDLFAPGQDIEVLIADVLQCAKIIVNEEGTEAAAATGVIMGVTSMPMPREPLRIEVNRPFLFFLREANSGAVLFSGRVSRPEAE